jgi:hypothetical protein
MLSLLAIRWFDYVEKSELRANEESSELESSAYLIDAFFLSLRDCRILGYSGVTNFLFLVDQSVLDYESGLNLLRINDLSLSLYFI